MKESKIDRLRRSSRESVTSNERSRQNRNENQREKVSSRKSARVRLDDPKTLPEWLSNGTDLEQCGVQEREMSGALTSTDCLPRVNGTRDRRCTFIHRVATRIHPDLTKGGDEPYEVGMYGSDSASAFEVRVYYLPSTVQIPTGLIQYITGHLEEVAGVLRHIDKELNLKTNDNEVQDGMFIMEDLGKGRKENLNTHSPSINIDVTGPPPLGSFKSVSKYSNFEGLQSNMDGEKDCWTDKKNISSDLIDDVKTPRTEFINQQPSVRILFSSLPRSSKRKLEEMLNHWSEWHAQHCSSTEDPIQVLEFGDETYFPALHIGQDKSSTMAFSMDNHGRERHCKESLQLKNDCIPLYDREYALALTSDDGLIQQERSLDLREASRCFNCGSYNHTLNKCTKALDNDVVSKARKEYQSKKGGYTGPSLPTRYYQNSLNGKYDGLRPGVLSTETRKLLGLKELDPPPWLNRMRELGYPPGYLDLVDEDQPSGIAIYGDEEEPGDPVGKGNLKSPVPTSQRKMSVEFPGINAPLPENADRRSWASCQYAPNSYSSSKHLDTGHNYFPKCTDNRHSLDQWQPRSCREIPSPQRFPEPSCFTPHHLLNYPAFAPHNLSEYFNPGDILMTRSPPYWSPPSNGGMPFFNGELPIHSPYSLFPH
ncbi:hypothetical protein Nepgr_003683 [Nepenthes gracilis]|uniref:PSP proline-rich domain-containing protein n=1 Tax=Nepenthes gracilis TaxID=150966 RepID=A0AAD3XDZ8_NEPGR|nr:hypothetical protein Nepgr_003683 [Nepenthes gracilis]